MDQSLLEEFESLLLDWEDGSLDEAGAERLRDMLRHHPEARSRYVEMQMIVAAMHLDGGTGLPPMGPQNPAISMAASSEDASARSFSFDAFDDVSRAAQRDAVSEKVTPGLLDRPHRSWVTWMISIAAALLLCVGVTRWIIVESKLKSANQAQANGPQTSLSPIEDRDENQSGDGVRDGRVEATSQGVALVTRLVDVDWSDPDSNSQVGDALSPGAFKIMSGFAQIEFFCGATVVLQGPAELELESSTSARLLGGQLRAQVPPAARGFQIHVDDLRVEDLGTEFGISMTSRGTDVHVFDGEVKLHQASEQTRLVTAGQAVQLGPGGELGESTVAPQRFTDLQSLDSQAKDQIKSRYERWRSASTKMRRDPRLITYYSMDGEQWNRKLPCSVLPTNSDLDGAIVGARRVAGRWPSKQALEFKRPGDRVRVDLKGEFESLTFMCWVKIDSLDRWYNSLFLTDNYQRGEPHWQILDSGQLFFSVRVREGEVGQEHREVLSPPFWKPSMSGQWLHLATTYDVDQKQTTHYLNGTMLSQESIPDVQLVTPNSNWKGVDWKLVVADETER